MSGERREKLYGLAAEALEALKERGLTLATAESTLGGLIGDLLTDVPGSSAAYKGSAVVYHNDLKVRIGVPEQTLTDYGAVSQAAAEAMARAVREWSGAGVGLAETGIAGPGGGTEERPAGLFHVALAANELVIAERHVFPFDRRGNKEACAEAALRLLLRYLSES